MKLIDIGKGAISLTVAQVKDYCALAATRAIHSQGCADADIRRMCVEVRLDEKACRYSRECGA